MSSGIQIHPSGVESDNALGTGERHYSYLLKIFNKVRDYIPNFGKADALRLAVKAVNDTAGTAGLVPMLLVFGVLPRFPIFPKD